MWTSSHSSSPSHCSNFHNTTTNHPILGNSNNNTTTTTTTNCSDQMMFQQQQQVVPKNMEDIWRDISRGSGINIHDKSSSGRVILQDFFSRDSVPSPVNEPSTTPPPVMLTLRSTFLEDPVAATGGDFAHPQVNNKRFFGDHVFDDKNRRHKRMIKNRESAARSRARKQAYTNELENEVAHLLEENARLKKQQHQIYEAAAAQQRKNYKPLALALHRTSSAPF